MVHYKNIFFNLSNGIMNLPFSTAANPYADSDVLFLARSLLSRTPIVGYNRRKYYYFGNCFTSPEIIRYVLNQNGVLAYRHYSKFQIFGGDRRDAIRVPLWYLYICPTAVDFIKKVREAQAAWTKPEDFNITQFKILRAENWKTRSMTTNSISHVCAAMDKWSQVEKFDIVQYLDQVKKRMRQDGY